jgi:tRNA(Arg) A34 adenosine deaminase TadA
VRAAAILFLSPKEKVARRGGEHLVDYERSEIIYLVIRDRFFSPAFTKFAIILTMTHEDYMREAMKEADIAVSDGNAPFGVVVVDNDSGEIICREHDRVKEYWDPTAHGEINAIRKLCKELKTLSLANTIFYTTSEPCPTCLTGMIKAKVPANYYGAETEVTASLPIKAKDLAKFSKKYPIQINAGLLAKECFDQRNKY